MERTYPKQVDESKIPSIIGVAIGISLAVLSFYFVWTDIVMPQEEGMLRQNLAYLGLTPADKVDGTNCYVESIFLFCELRFLTNSLFLFLQYSSFVYQGVYFSTFLFC